MSLRNIELLASGDECVNNDKQRRTRSSSIKRRTSKAQILRAEHIRGQIEEYNNWIIKNEEAIPEIYLPEPEPPIDKKLIIERAMNERRRARQEEKILQKLARRFIRFQIKRFYESYVGEYTPIQVKRVKRRLKQDVPHLLRKVVSENIVSASHSAPTCTVSPAYEDFGDFENISIDSLKNSVINFVNSIENMETFAEFSSDEENIDEQEHKEHQLQSHTEGPSNTEQQETVYVSPLNSLHSLVTKTISIFSKSSKEDTTITSSTENINQSAMETVPNSAIKTKSKKENSRKVSPRKIQPEVAIEKTKISKIRKKSLKSPRSFIDDSSEIGTAQSSKATVKTVSTTSPVSVAMTKEKKQGKKIPNPTEQTIPKQLTSMASLAPQKPIMKSKQPSTVIKSPREKRKSSVTTTTRSRSPVKTSKTNESQTKPESKVTPVTTPRATVESPRKSSMPTKEALTRTSSTLKTASKATVETSRKAQAAPKPMPETKSAAASPKSSVIPATNTTPKSPATAPRATVESPKKSSMPTKAALTTPRQSITRTNSSPKSPKNAVVDTRKSSTTKPTTAETKSAASTTKSSVITAANTPAKSSVRTPRATVESAKKSPTTTKALSTTPPSTKTTPSATIESARKSSILKKPKTMTSKPSATVETSMKSPTGSKPTTAETKFAATSPKSSVVRTTDASPAESVTSPKATFIDNIGKSSIPSKQSKVAAISPVATPKASNASPTSPKKSLITSDSVNAQVKPIKMPLRKGSKVETPKQSLTRIESPMAPTKATSTVTKKSVETRKPSVVSSKRSSPATTPRSSVKYQKPTVLDKEINSTTLTRQSLVQAPEEEKVSNSSIALSNASKETIEVQSSASKQMSSTDNYAIEIKSAKSSLEQLKAAEISFTEEQNDNSRSTTSTRESIDGAIESESDSNSSHSKAKSIIKKISDKRVTSIANVKSVSFSIPSEQDASSLSVSEDDPMSSQSASTITSQLPTESTSKPEIEEIYERNRTNSIQTWLSDTVAIVADYFNTFNSDIVMTEQSNVELEKDISDLKRDISEEILTILSNKLSATSASTIPETSKETEPEVTRTSSKSSNFSNSFGAADAIEAVSSTIAEAETVLKQQHEIETLYIRSSLDNAVNEPEMTVQDLEAKKRSVVNDIPHVTYDELSLDSSKESSLQSASQLEQAKLSIVNDIPHATYATAESKTTAESEISIRYSDSDNIDSLTEDEFIELVRTNSNIKEYCENIGQDIPQHLLKAILSQDFEESKKCRKKLSKVKSIVFKVANATRKTAIRKRPSRQASAIYQDAIESGFEYDLSVFENKKVGNLMANVLEKDLIALELQRIKFDEEDYTMPLIKLSYIAALSILIAVAYKTINK